MVSLYFTKEKWKSLSDKEKWGLIRLSSGKPIKFFRSSDAIKNTLYHHACTDVDEDDYDNHKERIYTIRDLNTDKYYRIDSNSSCFFSVSFADASFTEVKKYYLTLDSKLSNSEKIDNIHKNFGRKDGNYIIGPYRNTKFIDF